MRFNTETWPMATRMTWTDQGRAMLNIEGRRTDLATVTAVWHRRPVAPRFPAGFDIHQAEWAALEAREAIGGMWRTINARWVNKPLADQAASSKPEQLRRARAMGFSVPTTLITNDPVEAREFAERGPTICKPLGRGGIIIDGRPKLFFTRLLNKEDVAALADVGPEPYLFQRHVPKRFDARVIVIGEEAFAARIDSQGVEASQTDWRATEAVRLPHAPLDLPDDVAEFCVSFVRSYGLLFGAIDLAVDAEGRYVFFENNPAGQWAWLEHLADLPLRRKLADLLTAT